MVNYVYDAWGNHKALDGGQEITNASHVGNVNCFRYRGYIYDRETGLYYLKSRYYDPQTGRFINMDGVEYADPSFLNGLNLYAYCNNNPVMNIDPNGNAWHPWGVIGATIDDYRLIKAGAADDPNGVYAKENGDSVKIYNSYLIKTPWMMYAYSRYLNHSNEKTKDIIKGSTSGVQFEWQMHNLAYLVGSFLQDQKIIDDAKDVDIGATIFDDEHIKDEKSALGSFLMKAAYIGTRSIVRWGIDWLIYYFS